MKLFHRTSKEASTSILKKGFKDRTDPSGKNYGFGDQIPPIKGVWFGSVPLEEHEGAVGDVLFLLEIPDEVVQDLDAEVREEGRLWTEYVIPAEVANQYGPPTNITDSEEEYSREWPGYE